MNVIIEGDILNLDVKEYFLLHQVNCRKIANAGLAKQIREKYPDWYNDFVNIYGMGLGDKWIFNCGDGVRIVNLYGQFYVGHGLQTNYNALSNAMRKFKHYYDLYEYNQPIYIPYGIGCGLGGGDWNVVSKLIEEIIPEAILVKYVSSH